MHESGRTVILIGHAGHPEVIGTMGQLPPGTVLLVEDVAQAEPLRVPDPYNLAYATQTTLSVDDTIGIVAALRRRFPAIQGPKMEDICYATTNRQAAVKAIAERVRRAGGDRRAQLVELDAAGRGRGQLRLRASRGWCSAPPTWTGTGWAMPAGSASPPAPRRPSCWSTS